MLKTVLERYLLLCCETNGRQVRVLPLYRQAQMYAHEGVELEGSTMSDAIGGISALLSPWLTPCVATCLSQESYMAMIFPSPFSRPAKAVPRLADCGSTCAGGVSGVVCLLS